MSRLWLPSDNNKLSERKRSQRHGPGNDMSNYMWESSHSVHFYNYMQMNSFQTQCTKLLSHPSVFFRDNVACPNEKNTAALPHLSTNEPYSSVHAGSQLEHLKPQQ